MNLDNLKIEIKKLYGPVLGLENYISHVWRRKFELSFLIIWIIGLTFYFSIYLLNYLKTGVDLLHFESLILGFTGLAFVVWIKFFLLESFYFSYYFKDVNSSDFYIDFELASAVYNLDPRDIGYSFFKTKYGKIFLMRSGISTKELDDFLSQRTSILSDNNFNSKYTEKGMTLGDFVLAITDSDKQFADFLFKFGIQKKEILGISEWIVELYMSKAQEKRWWSKENLGRVPSIGRNWSYGQIYTIKKYERPLVLGSTKNYRIHSSYGVKELAELEAVLLKSRDANVILVGDDEAGKLQIISDLAQMIFEGSSMDKLDHKRIILIDDDKLVASNGTKSGFETEFIKLLQEAVSAGNMILVIEDLPSLVSSCTSIGVDFPSLIESYLTSMGLQFIALSGTDGFHSVVERNSILSQHFESILIKEIDDSNTIKVLQNEVLNLERSGLFFTYASLETIVDSSERYFPSGIMPDKAVDLLLEIAPRLLSQGKSVVFKNDVLELVEIKTGIPVTGVSSIEKDKLLNLEEILHKRIVGQDEAVKTISNAVRRARSGITNPNRPLGSFLFLGPTGVGKTETTKALAQVFFGDNANILRLDMSEYSGFDSVSKLIGSFEGKQTGVLSTMLKEHPYGVLLLDEFEKTTKEVMNLFLQVLDEGFFSDMNGKKIMARNLIIIATSNAGSDLIWEAMQNKQDMTKAKDSIVDGIIKSGIFKPELMNRFDGVVLFHPLEEAHLRKIGELQLQKLHERLSEQGINLTINENLINYVVSFGTDPKFGARPMNRAIQEKVEEIVARKIIAGSIPKGSTIELTPEELV